MSDDEDWDYGGTNLDTPIPEDELNSTAAASSKLRRTDEGIWYRDDQKVYSQPPGISLPYIATYSYQDESPGVARIYIIDSGANTQSSVREGIHNRKYLLTCIGLYANAHWRT